MKADYTYFISHTRFDVVSKHVLSQVHVDAVSLPIVLLRGKMTISPSILSTDKQMITRRISLVKDSSC